MLCDWLGWELPDIDVCEELEVSIKYEGYIRKQADRIARQQRMETTVLPEIDYARLTGISLEARQKLAERKPETLGQASRISGVSPADISVLMIYLEQRRKRDDT